MSLKELGKNKKFFYDADLLELKFHKEQQPLRSGTGYKTKYRYRVRNVLCSNIKIAEYQPLFHEEEQQFIAKFQIYGPYSFGSKQIDLQTLHNLSPEDIKLLNKLPVDKKLEQDELLLFYLEQYTIIERNILPSVFNKYDVEKFSNSIVPENYNIDVKYIELPGVEYLKIFKELSQNWDRKRFNIINELLKEKT